jgi:hypothetical protein
MQPVHWRYVPIAHEDFLASLVLAICGDAIAFAVGLRMASRIRVVEVVHEWAHSVAVIFGREAISSDFRNNGYCLGISGVFASPSSHNSNSEVLIHSPEDPILRTLQRDLPDVSLFLFFGRRACECGRSGYSQ